MDKYLSLLVEFANAQGKKKKKTLHESQIFLKFIQALEFYLL